MTILSILPELILFMGAIITLMTDVFLGKKFKNISRICFLMAIIFSISALITVINSYYVTYLSFNNMFFVNSFTSLVKIVTLLTLICVLFISADFVEIEKRISSEFLALLMISTAGSMCLVSSNDLLPFYLSLELQSLSLYLLAAIKRDSSKSSEAGMKYFILGSVASGILLLGISFIYGFSGTTSLTSLAQNYYALNHGNIPIALMLGFTLVLIAMLFKISAVPFHMWTPDVYEGSTTIVTTFFASLIKFVSVIVLLRLYIHIIFLWPNVWQISYLVAVLSLLIGCFGGLRQTNLKRLLAYSGIGHIGFILTAFVAFDLPAIKSVILYLIIYSTLALGSFAALLLIFTNSNAANIDQKHDKIYDLSALSGIGKKHPIIALLISILMFSMAGIPPLAGFFAKFYVLLAVIEKGFYTLAIIAVLASVVSAFYYLRIVKIMYFDAPEKSDIEIEGVSNASIVLFLMAILNLFAFIYITPLLNLITRIF